MSQGIEGIKGQKDIFFGEIYIYKKASWSFCLKDTYFYFFLFCNLFMSFCPFCPLNP
jgi:hypothetical protein